ncbi:hypothetical protein EUGRSUZ_L02990 [Eucalyptus grandis]|uniref:Uncharacterized protein n=1 Tax=Eucalyptus grandis TaxID=71139 RepID=A0AAD9WI76_EUCGR|nr:hypothetical protein EUGRSUZ_L02990 [Eucalyptus grandis]
MSATRKIQHPSQNSTQASLPETDTDNHATHQPCKAQKLALNPLQRKPISQNTHRHALHTPEKSKAASSSSRYRST